MPIARAAAVVLGGVLCVALVGCGDNKKKGTVFDAGRDAGADAGPDASVLYDLPDYGDAMVPVPKPRCTDRECDRISGECRAGWCNEDTGLCEFDNADDGIACGDATNDVCTLPDLCMAGRCEPNHYPAMTPCGVERVCHERDVCDGDGVCVDKGFSPMGTACGDPSVTECDAADRCDGQGACDKNNAPLDTPCNLDKHVDCGGAMWPDTCSNGICIGEGLYAPGSCPRGNDGDGNCYCGPPVINPDHPCKDECSPTGICLTDIIEC